MVGIFGLVAAAALVSQSAAVPFSLKPRAGGPTVANPGPPSEVEITKYNTVNGTRHEGGNAKKPAVQGAPLKFSLFNNFGGEQLYAYVTGRDVNDTPVLLTSSGSWFYPNPAGSAQPIVIPADAGHTILLNGANETTEFSIPDWMSSGRVWVSEGELTFQTVAGADGIITIVEPSFVDPEDASSDLNWGFVELSKSINPALSYPPPCNANRNTQRTTRAASTPTSPLWISSASSSACASPSARARCRPSRASPPKPPSPTSATP